MAGDGLLDLAGDAEQGIVGPDIEADSLTLTVPTPNGVTLALGVAVRVLSTVDPATARGVASNPHDFGVALRRAGWRPEGAAVTDHHALGGAR